MGLFDIIKNMSPTNSENTPDIDKIAALVGMDREAYTEFEKAYKDLALDMVSDDIFGVSAKQMKDILKDKEQEGLSQETLQALEALKERIVDDLLAQTSVIRVRDGNVSYDTYITQKSDETTPVSKEDVFSIIPPWHGLRPQLTGTAMQRDLKGMAATIVLEMYAKWKNPVTPQSGMTAYNMFRQGLDIQDLDPILYAMLGTNPNSMGYWLPKIAPAVKAGGFFKIPDTSVVKVPMTLLQMTRLDYNILTQSTRDIANKFCMKAFDLDENKEYFIKTGTYSSKFDFRNAHVHGAKEVKEIGEYLLFIQNQAVMMAGPLSTPCIYGVSTTNEWVVRDYISPSDPEIPCIYKGLPLRTEYRVFADFDTGHILGIAPYWEPEMMKKRFRDGQDASSPHMKHDYVIIKKHEDALMKQFEANKDRILIEAEKLLSDTDIPGQWSIDIMQDGEGFYLIDMALAANSALKEYIPKGLLRPVKEEWLPAEAVKMIKEIST